MAQAEIPRSVPLVEARAHAAAGKGARGGVPVFLRRVSPRGAMVQGADIAERTPGGVLIIAGPGTPRQKLPRWRFGPRPL